MKRLRQIIHYIIFVCFDIEVSGVSLEDEAAAATLWRALAQGLAAT
jgi:hypothetical protein